MRCDASTSGGKHVESNITYPPKHKGFSYLIGPKDDVHIR